MDDEAYEIHARLACQAPATIATHANVRKSRLEKCRRIVIPQLGIDDEAIEVRPRQNAEIPEANIAAGEHPVQKRVATIHEPERQTLKTAAALGKYGSRMPSVSHGLQKPRNVLWPVLAIRIHHDDCVALPILLEVSEPDSNRPLMTQVAA